MCGIAGIYRRDDGPISDPRLRAMQNDLIHRGPDVSGLHIESHLGLAFRRLSIIDLSPSANQPMASDDGEVSLVFNGEIYNFKEMREQLLAMARQFRTQSDTEVILQGYQQWGLGVFSRLNGMFAVALWDRGRQTLYLVRDRVGKKPLFYHEADGEIVFASEVRALVKGLKATPPVDPQTLDLYLTYMCVPGDRSIFSRVRKVSPGTIVTCTRESVSVQRYWKISFRTKHPLSEPEALEQLDSILADATRIRMISDVPLGAFLSGGVDSSTVVALMSRFTGRVRTFSIGFTEESFNELPYARVVANALGTCHTEITVEPDAAAILPRLVWHYGEPFADSSAVPSYYVSAAARREVTVILNGDGGDEGFAGYQWHRTIRAAEVYRRVCPGPLRRALAPVSRYLASHRASPAAVRSLTRLTGNWGGTTAARAFWIWPGLRDSEREGLYTSSFRSQLSAFDPEEYCREAYGRADGLDDLDRALQVGLETYLPDDLLVKIDIASMANSLEARSPLLDYRVLEFAAHLPSSLKVRGMKTKHLLKAYAETLVPSSVIRRPKRGFSIPLNEWLRGPLRRPLEILLNHPRAQARGYFEASTVRQLIERHMAGEDHGARLWSLLWLELWFRMFVDGDLRRDDSLRDL